ncbi:MAG: IS110 family transposase [Candidatus Zixiibacteriota bacterium]|nr:MAG: IS110 family transposase [candidate division Zixibacteria bacterium]
MWYVGVDLGWKSSVIALLSDDGIKVSPKRFSNQNPSTMMKYLSQYKPFKAVIEATGSYRWIYELLIQHGEVILAHPFRLRAIWSGKAKTDKLDAKVLAELLRADLMPESYVPPPSYQVLRDITRARARLVRRRTRVRNELRSILACANIESPMSCPFGPRGLKWFASLQLNPAADIVRDELIERLEYFETVIHKFDERLKTIAGHYPQTEALIDIPGFALYTALLVIAEYGQPWRFRQASQAAAYAGLTPRVYQSGQYEHRGKISKQGSPWLRWILVEAAFKVTRKDEPLRRFYERVRRRRGKQAGRIAVARKLAEICWKRLMAWHQSQAA